MGSNECDLKRCFVRLIDIRSNSCATNLLNMPPTSLGPENRTGAKNRLTPIDDLSKKKKERSKETETDSNDDASYKESNGECETDSEDDNGSYKESGVESETDSEIGVESEADSENGVESETDSENGDASHKESSEESETNSEDDDPSYGKRKKMVALSKKSKRTVKKKKESSEESETNSEDYDPSYGKRKKKTTLSQKSKRTVKKKETAVLSAYEKMVLEKKAEKLAFLESLKIDEVKADFSEFVNTMRGKPKHDSSKKVFSKTRSSNRLASRTVSQNFSENNLIQAAFKAEENPHSISSKMAFRDALYSLYSQDYENYVEDINIHMPNSTVKHFSYDRSIIQNLNLDCDNIIKVLYERITGISWYPSADHLILAAGSKTGNISICNYDSGSCPYIFKIHNKKITCLQFNPFYPVHLLSSSYDGILRRGDLINQEFTEIYSVFNEASCEYFDFLSPTTYLVALNNGEVVIIDERKENRIIEKRHTCHSNSIRSVNIHPVNKNFFITAGSKGSVRLWDLRRLRRIPVADINDHGGCVHSAFFSPLTGSSILTTSMVDSICIYDSTKLIQDIRLTKQFRYNGNTRSLQNIFRASWLPHSDDLFVVGHVDILNPIQVLDKDMNICHQFKTENLRYRSYIYLFHPFKPALASGTATGKVFLYL